MAKTPPPVVPRSVNVSVTTSDEVPAGAQLRAQSGALQLRDFDRAGRAWKETYRTVRTRDASDMEWLSRLQWFRARSKRFWIDHQLLNGSGQSILGTGRENLIRDAAMDTDSDSDGVVDGFSSFGAGDADVTFSLNSTAGAQRISLADTSDGDETAWAQQFVLRVFPGDEVTISVDVRALNVSGSPKARLATKFEDSGGADLSTDVSTNVVGQTSFGRVALTLTAPEDTHRLLVTLRVDASAAGDAVDFDARDARVLRASSDPATWGNPHVSGGSQTGDTLDTAGWPADTRVLEAGDVFRIGGSGATKAAAETDEVITSFKVLAPVDSDGSGAATVPIDPPIFTGNAPPDGAALRFEGMRLRAGLVGGNLRRPSKLVNKYGGLSAVFVEAL